MPLITKGFEYARDNILNRGNWLSILKVPLLYIGYQHLEVWWYVSKNLVIIGSGNGLAPVWCQAITWTNADSVLSPEPMLILFYQIDTYKQTSLKFECNFS